MPAERRKVRVAVVVVHGMGEQRPLETLDRFTDTALARLADDDGRAYYSRPALLTGSYEARRHLAIRLGNQNRPTRVQTDIFEYHWSYLMTGNRLGDLVPTTLRLLWRRPGSVPAGLRGVWWVVWAAFVVALAAAVVVYLTGLGGVLAAVAAVPVVGLVAGGLVLGAPSLDRPHHSMGEGRAKKPQPWTTTISASSVLYGATVIADDGASEPLPTASVLTRPQSLFQPVTRVTSWTAWRRAVKRDKPNLLVVLGHTMVEGGSANLYIGKKSVLARLRISTSELRVRRQPSSARAPHRLRDRRAGRSVRVAARHADREGRRGRCRHARPRSSARTAPQRRRTCSARSTIWPGQDASVGDAVEAARRSLIAERRPIGLILVSHGEMDTKVVT